MCMLQQAEVATRGFILAGSDEARGRRARMCDGRDGGESDWRRRGCPRLNAGRHDGFTFMRDFGLGGRGAWATSWSGCCGRGYPTRMPSIRRRGGSLLAAP